MGRDVTSLGSAIMGGVASSMSAAGSEDNVERVDVDGVQSKHDVIANHDGSYDVFVELPAARWGKTERQIRVRTRGGNCQLVQSGTEGSRVKCIGPINEAQSGDKVMVKDCDGKFFEATVDDCKLVTIPSSIVGEWKVYSIGDEISITVDTQTTSVPSAIDSAYIIAAIHWAQIGAHMKTNVSFSNPDHTFGPMVTAALREINAALATGSMNAADDRVVFARGVVDDLTLFLKKIREGMTDGNKAALKYFFNPSLRVGRQNATALKAGVVIRIADRADRNEDKIKSAFEDGKNTASLVGLAWHDAAVRDRLLPNPPFSLRQVLATIGASSEVPVIVGRAVRIGVRGVSALDTYYTIFVEEISKNTLMLSDIEQDKTASGSYIKGNGGLGNRWTVGQDEAGKSYNAFWPIVPKNGTPGADRWRDYMKPMLPFLMADVVSDRTQYKRSMDTMPFWMLGTYALLEKIDARGYPADALDDFIGICQCSSIDVPKHLAGFAKDPSNRQLYPSLVEIYGMLLSQAPWGDKAVHKVASDEAGRRALKIVAERNVAPQTATAGSTSGGKAYAPALPSHMFNRLELALFYDVKVRKNATLAEIADSFKIEAYVEMVAGDTTDESAYSTVARFLGITDVSRSGDDWEMVNEDQKDSQSYERLMKKMRLDNDDDSMVSSSSRYMEILLDAPRTPHDGQPLKMFPDFKPSFELSASATAHFNLLKAEHKKQLECMGDARPFIEATTELEAIAALIRVMKKKGNEAISRHTDRVFFNMAAKHAFSSAGTDYKRGMLAGSWTIKDKAFAGRIIDLCVENVPFADVKNLGEVKIDRCATSKHSKKIKNNDRETMFGLLMRSKHMSRCKRAIFETSNRLTCEVLTDIMKQSINSSKPYPDCIAFLATIVKERTTKINAVRYPLIVLRTDFPDEIELIKSRANLIQVPRISH